MIIQIAAVVASVLTATLVVGVNIWSKRTPETRQSQLKIADLRFTARPMDVAYIANGGSEARFGQYTDVMDLTLTNTGASSSVVTSIEFQLESRNLYGCTATGHGGGEMDLSGVYDLALPEWRENDNAETSRSAVTADAMHFEVTAGGSERLALSLGQPHWPEDFGPRLYTARVTVAHDRDASSLRAGDVAFLSPSFAMAHLMADAALGHGGDTDVAACVERYADLIEESGRSSDAASVAVTCYPDALRSALKGELAVDPCPNVIAAAATDFNGDLAPTANTSVEPAASVEMVERREQGSTSAPDYEYRLTLPDLRGTPTTTSSAWTDAIEAIIEEKRASLKRWIADVSSARGSDQRGSALDVTFEGSVLASRFAAVTLISAYQASIDGVGQTDADTVVLDLTSGEVLELGDVVTGGAGALQDLVVTAMEDGVSDGGTMPCSASVPSALLPLEDWTAGPSGLMFWFDKYEVSSGACSVTTEIVAWRSLEPLLTPLGLNLERAAAAS